MKEIAVPGYLIVGNLRIVYANEYVNISKQNTRGQLCDKRNDASFSMVDVRDGSVVSTQNTTEQLCKNISVNLPVYRSLVSRWYS